MGLLGDKLLHLGPYFLGVALRLVSYLKKGVFSWLTIRYLFSNVLKQKCDTKTILRDLLTDHKEYLVGDDYPTSTVFKYLLVDNFDNRC